MCDLFGPPIARKLQKVISKNFSTPINLTSPKGFPFLSKLLLVFPFPRLFSVPIFWKDVFISSPTKKNQGFQAFKLPRQKLLLDFSCRLFGYPPDVQQNTTLILNLAVKTPTKMNNSQRQHQQKWIFIFFNQVVLEITTTNTKKIISTRS